jgi:hypothetical protein
LQGVCQIRFGLDFSESKSVFHLAKYPLAFCHYTFCPLSPVDMMGSIIVVIKQPFVQIFLEFIQVAIELFAERDLIELLQNGLVEALRNPVGLRMPGLGFGVVDVINRQIQLVIMLFDLAAIFGAPIRQDTQHGQSVGLIEWQHFVIQQIRCRDRRFAVYSLQCATLL